MQWRVPSKMPFLKGAAASVFAVVAIVFAGDAAQLAVAGLAACVLGAMALRDIIAPVRLAVDETGVWVAKGFAGRRFVRWSDVERIRLDARQRWGRRQESVEVDTGEHLYLFSPQELDAACDEVVATLREYREASRMRAEGTG